MHKNKANPGMNSPDPHSIRQIMRKRRRAIGYGAQQRAAFRLAESLVGMPEYQQSQHIAVYWAVGGEIDLRELIKRAWADDKSCYLPVLQGSSLGFACYRPGSQLVNNRFGIPEPKSTKAISPEALDLVLLPLVAFDSHCHRIGMGGGFYDRTFAKHEDSHQSRRPVLIGVGHRCQHIPMIEPMPWDVRLDNIVTD